MNRINPIVARAIEVKSSSRLQRDQKFCRGNYELPLQCMQFSGFKNQNLKKN